MIRRATRADIPALMDIYNEAILHTTATFDMEIKDIDNRTLWFEEHEKHPYVLLVEEEDGIVKGYASLSRYRERQAFDHTVEISVYIDEKYRGQGVGTALMKETVQIAKDTPFIHSIVSLIEGGNAASIRLHENLGFVHCGTIKEVGYKFDRWLDLSTYQLMLR